MKISKGKPKKQLKPRGKTADGLAVWCHYDELNAPELLPDYPGNPNTHPDEQLDRIIEIIKSNGWREPITRSRLSGRITKGHGRKQAALRARWKQVPVAWQDYASEADERRDVLADNRAREGAGIDDELLSAMLAGIDEKNGSGFTEDESAALIESLKPEEKPEVKFAEWIDEANNYVVLQFRNEIDWIAAVTHFKIETVANKRSTGKEWGRGIGRVIDGAKYLQRING